MEKEKITWKIFKDTLLKYPNLDLQFQYTDNKWADAAYHITEIKQASIQSVDCGGALDNWTEVIIQLYEPQNSLQLRAMKVLKAIGIINQVEKSLHLSADAIVKIEFGNAKFDTRQLLSGNILADNEDLIVDLRPDTVQCKAIERGGNCVNENAATTSKPTVMVVNTEIAGKSCKPGSGCC